jgi:hypothetical protein
MSVIGNQQLTLLDHAKRTDPEGKIARIVEMLNRVNHITDDMTVLEGNTQTGHVTTLRTGLPQIAWRSINVGVQPSKSTTKQLTVTAGILEGMGKVDEELVELAADGAALRLSEVSPFMESFAQTLATTLFYGDVRVNPDRFTGLSAYYSKLNATYQANPDAIVNPSSTLPDSGRNVFNAAVNSEGEAFGDASAGTNTSLWLIVWGEQSVHTFFPKGTRAGIYHEDKGKWLVDDGRGVGASYWAYIDQYKAKLGLVVRDWRQAVRICNIDVTALASAGDDNDQSANLIKNAIQAVNYVQFLNAGKAMWYCNRVVKTYLEVKAMSKFNAFLKIEDVQTDHPVTKLMGIPVRRCDALVNTEAAVS